MCCLGGPGQESPGPFFSSPHGSKAWTPGKVSDGEGAQGKWPGCPLHKSTIGWRPDVRWGMF